MKPDGVEIKLIESMVTRPSTASVEALVGTGVSTNPFALESNKEVYCDDALSFRRLTTVAPSVAEALMVNVILASSFTPDELSIVAVWSLVKAEMLRMPLVELLEVIVKPVVKPLAAIETNESLLGSKAIARSKPENA